MVLKLLLLICLFEIIEEKYKITLTCLEPVPWPSLMEVFFGHQHWKLNPPQWPLQSVFDDFNGDCWPSE